jgi:hypothetical protein
MIGTGWRRRLASLFFVLAASVLAAEAPRGLRDSRLLSFAVSDFRDSGGKRWIRMSCEYEGHYKESVDDLVATLWDFPRSPRVFSRIEAVRVRSDADGAAVTEQKSAVRVLGLAFVSNLVFSNRVSRDGPGDATVSFEMIETDGSCLSAKGCWTFEDDPGPDGGATLARYSIESCVAPRFPGQEAVMRIFGAAEIGRLMRELGAAVARKGDRG